MKLIIAHLPQDAFGPVRTALHRLGVRTTVSEVRSCGSQPATTLNYRGAALQIHSRSELRLECLATAKQSPAVVSVLREHADHAAASVAPVIVLDLEEHHQAGVRDGGDFGHQPRTPGRRDTPSIPRKLVTSS